MHEGSSFLLSVLKKRAVVPAKGLLFIYGAAAASFLAFIDVSTIGSFEFVGEPHFRGPIKPLRG